MTYLHPGDIGINMETSAMSEGGDETWDSVNYEMSSADSLAVAAAAAAVDHGYQSSTDRPELVQTAFESVAKDERRTKSQNELRVHILQKRFQKGLGVVQLDWRFGKNEKLTPEEEEKRKTRRERNRVAASRCRERRRQKTGELVTETDLIEASNKSLMTEIQQLEAERQELLEVLAAHQQTCLFTPSTELHALPSQYTTPPVPLTPCLEDLHIDP